MNWYTTLGRRDDSRFEIEEGTMGSEESSVGPFPWGVTRPPRRKLVQHTYKSGTLGTPNGDSELEPSRFKDSKKMWSLLHTDFVGRDSF